MTVAEHLAAARSAHTRFQSASGHNNGRGTIKMPNDEAAAIAVRQALESRQRAQQMDPDHVDPAWSDDLAIMRVTSNTLLAFYSDYFAPEIEL